jgi:hypothetical protein
MSARLSSVFPRPSASDPDDVVWTLQTAAVQWQRGLRADAIVWVRKAADLSTQGGRTGRAEELRNHAARLAEFLWTDPEESAPSSSARSAQIPVGRRVISEDDEDEIIEVEELDSYELEFTETDLPTPEDAVADISPEDLSYYQAEEANTEGAVLPDDLDLRSDSPLPPAPGDSFLSVNPEEEDDSFISVNPESDSPDGDTVEMQALDDQAIEAQSVHAQSVQPPSVEAYSVEAESIPAESMQPESIEPERHSDSYLEVSPDSIPIGASPLPAAPQSDLPTMPRIELPPLFRRGGLSESTEGTRLPTVPSPTTVAAEELASSLHALQTAPPAARGSLLSEEVSPPDGPPGIDGLAFESVEALADLPEEAQLELAACGRSITLSSSEEYLLQEGAALVTHGQVHVTLPFSDVSGERIGGGSMVSARGSVEAGALRLIAGAERTRLVAWTDEQLSRAMRDCPWVEDDLRQLADRLQAHAGAGLGPLGERLDDALRAAVYERLTVRVLAPRETVAERGKPLKGLFVVAVGDLRVGGTGTESITSGQFVFPSCVIGAEPAPADVTAGPKGGVVLFATRPVAHELMMSVPPLLEILSS